MNDVLTRTEFYAFMQEFMQEVENRIREKKPQPNLITRKEIITEIGRDAYYAGVKRGFLTPIKNGTRNEKVRIDRREYTAWLQQLKK